MLSIKQVRRHIDQLGPCWKLYAEDGYGGFDLVGSYMDQDGSDEESFDELRRLVKEYELSRPGTDYSLDIRNHPNAKGAGIKSFAFNVQGVEPAQVEVNDPGQPQGGYAGLGGAESIQELVKKELEKERERWRLEREREQFEREKEIWEDQMKQREADVREHERRFNSQTEKLSAAIGAIGGKVASGFFETGSVEGALGALLGSTSGVEVEDDEAPLGAAPTQEMRHPNALEIADYVAAHVSTEEDWQTMLKAVAFAVEQFKKAKNGQYSENQRGTTSHERTTPEDAGSPAADGKQAQLAYPGETGGGQPEPGEG